MINQDLMDILHKNNFTILEESVKGLLYKVSHKKLPYNSFFISSIDEEVYLSIELGELKEKYWTHKVKKQQSWCAQLRECIQNATYIENKIMNDTFESLYMEEDSLENYVGLFVQNKLLEEYAVYIYNEFYDLDKKLAFKFYFNVENIEDKLSAIQRYIDSFQNPFAKLFKGQKVI
jgi:hypothetical protein